MMFDNSQKRYVTRGVNTQISHQVQLACWRLIDRENQLENELDYLQIFEFEIITPRHLAIIHRQEEPERVNQAIIELVGDGLAPCVEKLWVIDDGSTQTMLLPEEY